MRPDPDAQTGARLQTAAASIADWETFITHARRHGLLPLVHDRLRRCAPHAVPPDRFGEIESAVRTRTNHNLKLAAELAQLVAAFRARQIPVLAVKGPVLAQQAYAALGLRLFKDLDLVVHPADMPRALELFRERGFTGKSALSPRQQAAIRDSEHHFFLKNAQTGVQIELHWRLMQTYFGMALDEPGIWRRSVTVPLAGQTVPTLAPDDLVLFQCLHGAKHLWERLEWVADLAWLFARCRTLDWGWLASEAARLKVRRVFLLGCLMAEQVGGAALPSSISAAARRDEALYMLGRDLAARFEHESAVYPKELDLTRWVLRMQDDRSGQGRYLWRLLTATKEVDVQAADLPRSLALLYLVRRYLRLGAQALMRHSGG
jgi:hypothetical protein